MKNKRNIFLIGPMGAGKSSIGKQLASQLKMEPGIRIRLSIENWSDIDWIFDLEGEEGFRKREEAVIEELTQRQGIVLAIKVVRYSVLKIETFAARGTVLFLETSIEQQLERTRRDKKRPLIQNADDPKELFLSLKEERDPLYIEIADEDIYHRS